MKYKIFGISLFIVLLDRITKFLVLNNIIVNEKINIINNFFNFTYVKNFGGAFSSFSGARWLFLTIALLMIVFILFMIRDEIKLNVYKVIMYSFLIGGIVGNFIDRAFYGYVIDFIRFDFGNYIFPIFNLSDIAIVFGSILILFDSLKRREKI